MIGEAWAQSSGHIESDESSLDFGDAGCLEGALSLGDGSYSTLASSAVCNSREGSVGSGTEDDKIAVNEGGTAQGKGECLSSLDCGNDSHAGFVGSQGDLGVALAICA